MFIRRSNIISLNKEVVINNNKKLWITTNQIVGVPMRTTADLIILRMTDQQREMKEAIETIDGEGAALLIDPLDLMTEATTPNEN